MTDFLDSQKPFTLEDFDRLCRYRPGYCFTVRYDPEVQAVMVNELPGPTLEQALAHWWARRVWPQG